MLYIVYLKRPSCALNCKHGKKHKNWQSSFFQKHSGLWKGSCPGCGAGGGLCHPLPLSPQHFQQWPLARPTNLWTPHVAFDYAFIFPMVQQGPHSPKGQVTHFLRSEHYKEMHVESNLCLFGSDASIPLPVF